MNCKRKNTPTLSRGQVACVDGMCQDEVGWAPSLPRALLWWSVTTLGFGRSEPLLFFSFLFFLVGGPINTASSFPTRKLGRTGKQCVILTRLTQPAWDQLLTSEFLP
jgi:hypothetical protein